MKMLNLCSFKLYHDFPNSPILSNANKLFWIRIPDNHINIDREKENFSHLFMSSIKHETRLSSHAATVKKCTKGRDAHAKLLFC